MAFSHAQHAGRRDISCTYCHQTVETTAHAGIPTTETCMECHRVVSPNHPEVQKVANAFQEGRAIDWVRVTNLPEFVRFSHHPHIRAGVDCRSCHGDVAGMERVYQAHRLSMGECLSCHNQRNAPTDCYTCHF